MAKRLTFRCPQNGDPVICEVCAAPVAHRVEVLSFPGAKLKCPSHDVPLQVTR